MSRVRAGVLALAATAALVPAAVSADPLFKDFVFGGKTISGQFTPPSGGVFTVSLLLDVADYRNGTSHKVYIKPEDYKVNKGGWTGLLNCPTDGPGVKVVSAGSPPTLTCTWKVGPGSQPSGTVVLD